MFEAIDLARAMRDMAAEERMDDAASRFVNRQTLLANLAKLAQDGRSLADRLSLIRSESAELEAVYQLTAHAVFKLDVAETGLRRTLGG